MPRGMAPLLDSSGELLDRVHVVKDRPANNMSVEVARARVASSRAEKFDATLNVLYWKTMARDSMKSAEDIVRGAAGFNALETELDAEVMALDAAHANEIATIARNGQNVTDRTEAARDAVVPKAEAIWKRCLTACRELDESTAPKLELAGTDAAAALVFQNGLRDWTPKAVISHAAAVASTGSDALWSVIRGCLVRLRKSPPRHWQGLEAAVDGVLSLRGDPMQVQYDAWSLGREFAERSRRQIRSRLMGIVQA